MNKYSYSADILEQVVRETKRMTPSGTVVQATRAEDYGGTDFTLLANYRIPIQARVRYNRPVHHRDITIRTTEPSMMAAGTYAPLLAYFWVRGPERGAGRIVAGLLVDVYRIYRKADPPLADRPFISNSDGTAFHTIQHSELFNTGAMLKLGSPDCYAYAHVDAPRYLDSILSKSSRPTPPSDPLQRPMLVTTEDPLSDDDCCPECWYPYDDHNPDCPTKLGAT